MKPVILLFCFFQKHAFNLSKRPHQIPFCGVWDYITFLWNKQELKPIQSRFFLWFIWVKWQTAVLLNTYIPKHRSSSYVIKVIMWFTAATAGKSWLALRPLLGLWWSSIWVRFNLGCICSLSPRLRAWVSCSLSIQGHGDFLLGLAAGLMFEYICLVQVHKILHFWCFVFVCFLWKKTFMSYCVFFLFLRLCPALNRHSFSH